MLEQSRGNHPSAPIGSNSTALNAAFLRAANGQQVL
jgi:hypothetical protein